MNVTVTKVSFLHFINDFLKKIAACQTWLPYNIKVNEH